MWSLCAAQQPHLSSFLFFVIAVPPLHFLPPSDTRLFSYLYRLHYRKNEFVWVEGSSYHISGTEWKAGNHSWQHHTTHVPLYVKWGGPILSIICGNRGTFYYPDEIIMTLIINWEVCISTYRWHTAPARSLILDSKASINLGNDRSRGGRTYLLFFFLFIIFFRGLTVSGW